MAPKRSLSTSGRDIDPKRTKTIESGPVISNPIVSALLKSTNKNTGRVWKLPNANSPANRLLSATAQYPILEHIVAHLRPSDLGPLAQTCQSIHANLKYDQPKSFANLLTKTLCPGKGIKTRKVAHPRPIEGSFWPYEACGGEDKDSSIPSHPCVRCGVNTCDECRIHVTYQSMIEDPGLGNMRWWAGHIFLFQHVVRLFPPLPSPNTVGSKDPIADVWNAPTGSVRPLHDQGRLGLCFDIRSNAKPEPIDHLLDCNLGRHLRIKPKGPISGALHADEITFPLDMITMERTKRLCKNCSDTTEIPGRCKCTLRKRFVDRWVCIDCFQKECMEDRLVHRRFLSRSVLCQCGEALGRFPSDGDKNKIICNWCKGEVIEGADIDDEDDENTDNEDSEELNPVDHSSDFVDQPALAVAILNGSRIQWVTRDCASRQIMLEWEKRWDMLEELEDSGEEETST